MSNKYAEYEFLAVEKKRIPDANALCEELKKYLEPKISKRFRNRIRSMSWYSLEEGAFWLLCLQPSRGSHFAPKEFYSEFITHTLHFLKFYSTTTQLVFSNDEISTDVAMRNPVTWTLTELMECRHIPAGIAVTINDVKV